MPSREIEQDLNLKIQKVGPKAKASQNKKKNIPTYPMTMPLKRLVKTRADQVEDIEKCRPT